VKAAVNDEGGMMEEGSGGLSSEIASSDLGGTKPAIRANARGKGKRKEGADEEEEMREMAKKAKQAEKGVKKATTKGRKGKSNDKSDDMGAPAHTTTLTGIQSIGHIADAQVCLAMTST
jgi:hypothetical protein